MSALPSSTFASYGCTFVLGAAVATFVAHHCACGAIAVAADGTMTQRPAEVPAAVTTAVGGTRRLQSAKSSRLGRAGGRRAQPNLRTKALDTFYSANVPDDWKESGLSIEQLETHAKRPLVDVVVGILNLSSDWNLGAIMRTAALLKFCRFAILGRNKYDSRGAVGASRYISVQPQPVMMNLQGDGVDLDALRAYLIREKLAPIFVAGRGGGRGDTKGAGAVAQGSSKPPPPGSYSDGGVLLGALSWRAAYAALPEGWRFFLLFGNEGIGIPPEVLALRFELRGSFILSVEQYQSLFNTYNDCDSQKLSVEKDWDLPYDSEVLSPEEKPGHTYF